MRYNEIAGTHPITDTARVPPKEIVRRLSRSSAAEPHPEATGRSALPGRDTKGD